ncbi:hypothetical protein Y032_0048g1598 [Ancylostoma ceylanicum]|uniref:Uncharacterized protein n=1 Tax=Ancylostoma ceylanicum TaxID=53326 RepID=A0A016U9V6_9BILA|nr:hypothetical protein Y032_0048g1598 [Ancylostoma ceylanicum]
MVVDKGRDSGAGTLVVCCTWQRACWAKTRWKSSSVAIFPIKQKSGTGTKKTLYVDLSCEHDQNKRAQMLTHSSHLFENGDDITGTRRGARRILSRQQQFRRT